MLSPAPISAAPNQGCPTLATIPANITIRKPYHPVLSRNTINVRQTILARGSTKIHVAPGAEACEANKYNSLGKDKAIHILPNQLKLGGRSVSSALSVGSAGGAAISAARAAASTSMS
jgi:hypothetical protein